MNGKIITVTSMKGGVGKTETSLNIAAAIRKSTGKKVILVDFDIPYGGVAQALSIGKESSVTDWIRTNRFVSSEAIKSLVIKHNSGIDLLPTVASAFDVTQFTEDVANRILNQLTAIYDFIIVDSGVDLSPSTQAALLAAHRVIIVTAPHNVSVWNNHQYKEDLINMGVNPRCISLFINQVRQKQSVDPEQIIDLFKKSGTPIEHIYTAQDDEQIRKLRDLSQFIVMQHPKSSFSKTIATMLFDFGIVPIQQGKKAGEKSGLFSWFGRRITN